MTAPTSDELEKKPWLALKLEQDYFLSKLVRFVVDFSLFIFNIDLYAPYHVHKADCKQIRESRRYYLLTRLRIDELSRWDRARLKWAWFLSKYIIYLTGKNFLIIASQIIKHQTLGNGTRKILLTIKPDGLSASWLTYYCFQLDKFIGNPATFVTGLSAIVHFIAPIVLVMGAIVFPIHVSKGNWDARHARQLQSAQREIYLIDYKIEERLQIIEDLISGEKTFRQRGSSSCRTVLDTNSELHIFPYPMHWPSQDASPERVYLQRIVARLRTEPELMRPFVFRPQYHRLQVRNVGLLTLLFGLAFGSLIFVFPVGLWTISVVSRCEILYPVNKISVCDWTSVLTWREILSIFESTLAGTLSCWILTIFILITVGSTASQFDLVNDLNKHLVECLTLVETFNLQHNQRGRLSNSRKHKFAAQLFDLDTCLLRTLIKVSLSSDDIRRNSKCVSDTTDYYLAITGFLSLICVIIASNPGEQQQYDYSRQTLLVMMVLVSNFTLISNSAHYSKTSNLERRVSSIICQIIQMSSKRGESYFYSYIGSSWRKMALTNMFSDLNSVSIKFLNMIPMRFERVLEVNFILLSLATILNVH